MRLVRPSDPSYVFPCACCDAAVIEVYVFQGYPFRNVDDLSEHVVPLHSPDQDPDLGCN